MKDQSIKKSIKAEYKRQVSVLNLIASENYVSRDVCEALGSIFVDKYAEGYPGARYYAGNSIVDQVELLAQQRALGLFDLSAAHWDVNVQPYSGSPANLAILLGLVGRGEKIMGMRLDMGGHLTHGHSVSISGMVWRQIPYGVNKKTEQLDYDEINDIARKEKPKAIIAGFTAYSRSIDFKKFRHIADSIGALLIVDMSHIAGLIATGEHMSPFPYADVVMTTTHKTLRGPRSAMIFSKKQHTQLINKAVFPGIQGGPHMNQIAAVAVALREAQRPSFKKYMRQTVMNAQTLAASLTEFGLRIVSGGTDTHLMLVDVASVGRGGKEVSELLEHVGIIVNKNTIPFDERRPTDPSGIRLGVAALTTRGMKGQEMKKIASMIHRVISNSDTQKVAREARALALRFPIV